MSVNDEISNFNYAILKEKKIISVKPYEKRFSPEFFSFRL